MTLFGLYFLIFVQDAMECTLRDALKWSKLNEEVDIESETK